MNVQISAIIKVRITKFGMQAHVSPRYALMKLFNSISKQHMIVTTFSFDM